MRKLALILSWALTPGCLGSPQRNRDLLTSSDRVEIMANVYHLTDEKIRSITPRSHHIVRVRTGFGDWPGNGQQFEFVRTNGVWKLVRRGTWVQ
jgi:hypothetical protein